MSESLKKAVIEDLVIEPPIAYVAMQGWQYWINSKGFLAKLAYYTDVAKEVDLGKGCSGLENLIENIARHPAEYALPVAAFVLAINGLMVLYKYNQGELE